MGKLGKLIKKLERLSITEFSKHIRDALTSNFENVHDFLEQNKDKIIGFILAHIQESSLGEIGVLLYTLYVANKDVFLEIVRELVKFKDKIIPKVESASISEIAEFLSGLSFGEDIYKLADPTIDIVSKNIGKYTLHDIGEFMVYLGLADKNFANYTMSKILGSLNEVFSEFLENAPLDDIALFFSGISKIYSEKSTELLNSYKEKILDIFESKIENSDPEEITGFLLLMAQVNQEFVREIFEKYREQLKEKLGETMKTVETLLERIEKD